MQARHYAEGSGKGGVSRWKVAPSKGYWLMQALAFSSYGLSWNPTSAKAGHVLSASEDTTVAHW